MIDSLESVRRYLPSFEPFVTEDDVCVKELCRWKYDLSNAVIIDSLWQEIDFELAESYLHRLIAGEIAPAIVVNGATVEDGHHRIYAYRKWQERGGPITIPGVDLKDLMEIVDRWYSLE